MLLRSAALAALVSASIAWPSLATEPGTPMDCSDLELAPGLTCTTLTEPGPTTRTARATLTTTSRDRSARY